MFEPIIRGVWPSKSAILISKWKCPFSIKATCPWPAIRDPRRGVTPLWSLKLGSMSGCWRRAETKEEWPWQDARRRAVCPEKSCLLMFMLGHESSTVRMSTFPKAAASIRAVSPLRPPGQLTSTPSLSSCITCKGNQTSNPTDWSIDGWLGKDLPSWVIDQSS